MTTDQLQYLRRVLRPLAGQSWQASADRLNVMAEQPGLGRVLVASTGDMARARFIETFDPVRIAELLDELEQLRGN